MTTITPPPYIIEQFAREKGLVTDSVFTYWKGSLCALLNENYGNRYSIAQLVERVKKELTKSESKMFRNQAIKMI